MRRSDEVDPESENQVALISGEEALLIPKGAKVIEVNPESENQLVLKPGEVALVIAKGANARISCKGETAEKTGGEVPGGTTGPEAPVSKTAEIIRRWTPLPVDPHDAARIAEEILRATKRS
jgi:hypothetical protein